MAKYLSERENRADEVAGKKATDKDHLLQQVLFDLVQTDTIKKQPDARLAYSEKRLSRCINCTAATPNKPRLWC